MSKSFTVVALFAAVVAAGTLACRPSVESDAHAAGSAVPVVKVASPIAARVEDVSEHTGRAQAIDIVDIRARVSGHLQKVTFREGQVVKKGDLLFVVDPRPAEAVLARATAELARADADQGLSRRDAARAEQLFATHAIAERELDVQQSGLLQVTARTQASAAAVAAARLDLEFCFLRAPVAGRIGRVAVTPGNLVGPATPTPLTTLVSIDPLHVYVDIDETHAAHLARSVAGGMKAAHVGFADEVGYPHEGTIDFMDNRVDPQTGTQKVRVVVRNEGGHLTPGLFARVRITESEPRDSLLVADRAIGNDQDRRFVLVVDPAGKVQYRPVKLGPLHEGLRVVRDGLVRSDRVIVAGSQRVKPGVAAVPEPSTMDATSAGAHSGGLDGGVL